MRLIRGANHLHWLNPQVWLSGFLLPRSSSAYCGGFSGKRKNSSGSCYSATTGHWFLASTNHPCRSWLSPSSWVHWRTFESLVGPWTISCIRPCGCKAIPVIFWGPTWRLWFLWTFLQQPSPIAILMPRWGSCTVTQALDLFLVFMELWCSFYCSQMRWKSSWLPFCLLATLLSWLLTLGTLWMEWVLNLDRNFILLWLLSLRQLIFNQSRISQFYKLSWARVNSWVFSCFSFGELSDEYQ